jgi:hypothetical protein
MMLKHVMHPDTVRMFFQATLLYLLLFFPAALVAQINESDTLKTKASLSLSGFYQDGNVETLIFRAQSEVSFNPWRNSIFKTQNSYVYQEFGNVKADEDVLSLNFWYLNPQKTVHPFVLGFVSTNFRRRIDLRYLTGGGITLQLIQNPNQWLKVSLSSEYERTRFKTNDFNRDEYDGNDILSTFRGTIWISGRYQLFGESLILKHESYYQPSLEEANNYRWRADLGLELPVWEFLNVTLNYLHTFESIVVQDQKRQDRFFTVGFTVKSF